MVKWSLHLGHNCTLLRVDQSDFPGGGSLFGENARVRSLIMEGNNLLRITLPFADPEVFGYFFDWRSEGNGKKALEQSNGFWFRKSAKNILEMNGDGSGIWNSDFPGWNLRYRVQGVFKDFSDIPNFHSRFSFHAAVVMVLMEDERKLYG